MLNSENLKDLLHGPSLKRRDIVLLTLAVEAEKPKSVKTIKSLAKDAGIRSADKWNISDILSKSGHLVARINEGWILTVHGKEYISSIADTAIKTPSFSLAEKQLEKLISEIPNDSIRSFLGEALSCLRHKNFRAAVVLSWIGAVSILQHYVIENSNILSAFNNEASKRYQKWNAARTVDDLGRLKEKELLEILNSISVLGKNVKQELENCLTLRNSCGHPNSLIIGEQRVLAHLESLIHNVYTKFSITS